MLRGAQDLPRPMPSQQCHLPLPEAGQGGPSLPAGLRSPHVAVVLLYGSALLQVAVAAWVVTMEPGMLRSLMHYSWRT